MKTNFKRFMAMMLACLMVFGTFSSMVTAIDQDTCNHSWVNYGEDAVVDPTCEEKGYTWIICEHCNKRDIKDITDALGHDYEEVTVDPTCQADGSYTKTCTRCGDVVADEVIEATQNTIVNRDGSITVEDGCQEHGYGHHYEWVQVNEAKCGEIAEYWLMCTESVEKGNALPNGEKVCGFNYYGRNPDGSYAEGVIYEVKTHNFTQYDRTELLQEPTCAEFGILRVFCTEGCDEYVDVKVAKLAHTVVNHDAKAPTCTEIGWNAYETCEKCDYTTYVELGVIPHDYEIVTTTATCTTEGYTTYTCACGDTYTDNVKRPLGHAKRVEITKAPTCTENGVETWYCWRCDVVLGGRDLPATGHDWSDWTNTEGNCQTEATATRTCRTCNETDTETFEKGDHTKPAAEFITATVVKDPANRENSYCAIVYVCVICEEAITEKVDHRDMTYGEIQKYPTCTEEGVKADYCGACGYYKATFTEPTKHNYVETVVRPTCTEQGYSTFRCENVDLNTGAVCGDELAKGNYVPALGHAKRVEITKAPTCTENGEEVWYCWRCPAIIGGRDLPAFGHTAEEDDGDCTTAVHCATCDSVVVAAKDQHTPNTDSTDCTVEVSCTDCEEVLREATQHVPGPAATCKADQICTVCNKVLVEKSPNFHPQDDSVCGIAITRWPTCTEGAAGTLFCHLCATQDQELDWNTVKDNQGDYAEWIVELLKPEGHNLVQVKAKEATCQEAGYKAYEYCTKCDYTTYEATNIAPDNHSALGYHPKAVKKELNGVEMGWARTPSCYADGLVWYYCSDCAAKKGATYNGWTETVVGSIMDCHEDIANYGTELTEMEIFSTCSVAGKKFYKCTHEYDTCDTIKVVENGVVVGFDYRYSTYTCDEIISIDQPLAAHTFGIVNGLTFATCTAGATVDAKCLYCDYNFTVEEFNRYTGLNLSADALGHSYTSVDVAPTCTEAGYTLYTCSVCGYSYTEEGDKATEHKYDKVVTAPTCDEIGFTTYTCSVCGDIYVADEVAAKGHKYVDTVVAPTCTEAGYTDHICSVCGEAYTDTEVTALGHEEVVIFHDSTCTLEGSKLIYCANCTYHELTVIEPKGHDYVNHNGQAPTCTAPGWEDYQTCTRCDYTTYKVISATGHTPYEWNWSKVCNDPEHCYAPTCTENGRGVGRLCVTCGECVNEIGVDHAEIPAFGKDHAWRTMYQESTCTEFGFTYTICVQCGIGHGVDNVAGVITNYVPATGHDMKQDGVQAPTCTEDGWYYEYCDNGCGLNNVIGEAIPATGHDVPEHSYTDDKGNVQYYDEFVACKNNCGEKLPAHTDAEGNNVYERRYEVKYAEVMVDGQSFCRVTTYVIGYCDACEYKTVENIFITLGGHKNVVVDEQIPTNTEDGYTTTRCENCGGNEQTTEYDALLENKVVFDTEIYASDVNGNAMGDGSMIVNGGYMAVKVNMSGANVDIWSIYFDLVFDAEKLEFVGALDDNGFSNSYNAVGSTLRVASNYGFENLTFTGENETFVTLIFAVKVTAYADAANILADQFTFDKTQVLDLAKAPVDATFNEIGETLIWKAADLDESGHFFGMGDANELMALMQSRGSYDARADIDWDGDVDVDDFILIKEIIMNDNLVYGIYEDILSNPANYLG